MQFATTWMSPEGIMLSDKSEQDRITSLYVGTKNPASQQAEPSSEVQRTECWQLRQGKEKREAKW